MVEVGLSVVGGVAVAPDVGVLMDRVAAATGSADRAVQALLAWKYYAFAIGEPAMAAWVGHDRVPDLSAANVVVDCGDGRTSFALVEDRSIGAGRGLRVALSPLLDDHLPAVREQFRARVRLGRRAFDALAAAALVSAAAAAAPEGSAFEVADRLVTELGSDFASLVEVAELWGPDRGHRPMVLRSACCLVYRARDGYCSTCNLIDDEQRTAQLAAAGYRWRRRIPVEPLP